MMKKYKFFSDCDNGIDIHDCVATHIELEDDVLFFTFDGGFWVRRDDVFDDGKLHKTDSSALSLKLIEDEYIASTTVYVFTEKRNKAIRREVKLEELIEKVNSGKCQLEFLYHYKSFQTSVFECCLWFDKKPYHKECILILRTDDISYHWDSIRKDITC